MNRMFNFAIRNFKELIRDPLALVFEIILPLFLLFIFRQFDIPSENYKLENFTPGIVVFGLSFITLFTATLVAKDRDSALLMRLGASPMRARDYIFGYILSLFPIILIQNILFFGMACLMGLSFSFNVILVIIVTLFISVFFITLGILIGSLVSEKATGGVGSIVVQLVCFTSGMYFPSEMVGEAFARICEFLPFESSIKIIGGILNNSPSTIEPRNIVVISVYAISAVIVSSLIFRRKLKQ